MARCFDLAIEGGVAHLVLARGDSFNSMTEDFWRDLPAIMRGLDQGAKARVLVISSTGKHFSSGMDISVLTGGAGQMPGAERGRQRLHLRQTILGLQESFTVLENARLPVLVAIQGGCIGGALDMIAACDCRYATEDAFFQIQEINLGMTADVGTFPRLCKLMPEGMVREMAFSGRRLPATRARELGLINEVFPDQQTMLAAVMTLAQEMAEKSPLAMMGTKTMINYARDHSIADTLDYVATWQAGMYHPEGDMQESFAARSEKRPARYDELPPIKNPFAD